MLYLAEVQKQKSGLLGAAKAELKMLACQRADQSWTPVPGEEVIPAEEANNFNAGALVLADLNPNRQVQRIQEAGRPLVGILQNFSRQLEKSKSQEEEIEQWKQSLTYQSQELNRREMEMEARLEQMAQMEADFERLEAQRQEVDTGREAAERLQEEIERNRQELEGAWEHLRGEQRRFEERQSEFQQTTVLDEATAHQIHELLERLSHGIAPEGLRSELDRSLEMVANQQEILNQHWQQLEHQRGAVEQQQQEVDRQAQELQNRDREWQQAQNSLEQYRTELKVQAAVLNSKQEYAQILGIQLRTQEELYQQIYRAAETSANVSISPKVDAEALEKMSLEQLQQLVQDLQRDLQKVSRDVSEQEEELSDRQKMIDEVQVRLQQAAEPDRMRLETELAEEQDCYQMLNETLVGQRRNLREREEILSQHQGVLLRRQGKATGNNLDNKKIELGPTLVQLEAQRQQQSEEQQKLERQIEQMRSSIQQAQGMIDHQTHEQELKRQELQSLEQNLLSLRSATAESLGRINLYQEMLQPVQDSLDGLRQKLEELTTTLTQMQETGDYHLQTVAQMRQTLVNVMPSPQLAAS